MTFMQLGMALVGALAFFGCGHLHGRHVGYGEGKDDAHMETCSTCWRASK